VNDSLRLIRSAICRCGSVSRICTYRHLSWAFLNDLRVERRAAFSGYLDDLQAKGLEPRQTGHALRAMRMEETITANTPPPRKTRLCIYDMYSLADRSVTGMTAAFRAVYGPWRARCGALAISVDENRRISGRFDSTAIRCR